MTRWKKVLWFALGLIVALALLVVLFVGPWPVYRDSHFRDTTYYREACRAIDLAAAHAEVSSEGGPLKVGWAVREITPAPGKPMGGYSERPNDKKSTGIHDPLFVKAVAVSDGRDTLVIVGADLLQTLPNLVALVEKGLTEKITSPPPPVFYTTSHTHCGPGGLAPGLAASISYGKYDPELVNMLASRYVETIVDALGSMESARVAHGSLDGSRFVINRSRHAEVDGHLDFAVFERKSGDRCVMARFSAHPTIYPEAMLDFSAEYPGALQRRVREKTGAECVYLGGAVGSMGPNPPVEGAPEEEVQAMGGALGDMVVAALGDRLNWTDTVDVAGLVFTFGMPSLQARPVSPFWRLSPFMARVFGVLPEGRAQVARIGDLLLCGMPYDFSGEVSVRWRTMAREKGYDLWVTSHSGAYLGYLSPDRYYWQLGSGYSYDHNYEVGLMNWFGPDQEAYMTDLFARAVDRLVSPSLKP
ncbi:MAG TPA: neutral/alkaline non-lysosomal ceramidase N-terminal domain-containing protein [Candidatus Hydrogenedentes bacterium]|nr:neutral/alkaline non-lysosomal ceramidase N-terminal domain-containing protein [Candidatus Hydrogenedentota bacterium]